MDPQHRVFLEVRLGGARNAGYDPDRFDGLIGVYAGLGMNIYLLFNLASHPELVGDRSAAFSSMIGNDKDHLATRVSYKLNLRARA